MIHPDPEHFEVELEVEKQMVHLYEEHHDEEKVHYLQSEALHGAHSVHLHLLIHHGSLEILPEEYLESENH